MMMSSSQEEEEEEEEKGEVLLMIMMVILEKLNHIDKRKGKIGDNGTSLRISVGTLSSQIDEQEEEKKKRIKEER